jgi:predicted 3-demethylubiquinone-9 3-methyltransferase (glyoxalase superfamily)
MTKLSTMLWFDSAAETAAEHYVKAFADGRVIGLTRHGKDGPGLEGSVMMVEIEIAGQRFLLLNAGLMFQPTEANSYVIHCVDQAEVDRLWSHLGEGGSIQSCGWLKDQWGFSWQIVPQVFFDIVSGKDEAAKARAMAAMMTMTKFDVAAIEKAGKGEASN